MNPRLAALDFIAGCLSIDNTDNDDLRAVIASESLNWPMVISLADRQYISPGLWVALRERGLAENLPVDVYHYLEDIHGLNLTRNKHLKMQAIEAIRCLNGIGVTPILLKGGVSLFVKVYNDLGARVMTDLDILVPAKRAKDCWNLLRRVLGYAPVDNNKARVQAGLSYIDYSRAHHHLRPLHRPGNYGMLEIHRDLLAENAAQIMSAHRAWQQIELIETDGITFGVLTPTYRVLHNLSHAFIVDKAFVRGEIPLRSLHELALASDDPELIDWAIIQYEMAQGGCSKHLLAALYLCNQLFNRPLPKPIQPTLMAKIHYSRCLFQARWAWSEAVMDRVLWFSAHSICERYQCPNDWISITRGRLELAIEILINKWDSLGISLMPGKK